MIPIIDGVGLYPDGNEIPADYLEWGMELASNIVPLDFNGNPHPLGKIFLAALNGMSNAHQEMQALIELFRQEYEVFERLISLFDGDRATWDLWRIVNDPTGYYHDARGGVITRLVKQQISPLQVRLSWMKNSIRGLNLPEQASADLMCLYMQQAIDTSLLHFPNMDIILLSAAMWSGFGLRPLPRKEPQAFFEGLGIKKLIENNIKRFRDGNAKTFICWGAYMWANGEQPRSDGLYWTPSDFAAKDLIHPGPGALTKWSEAMLKDFQTNPTTKRWFPS